MFGRGYTYRVQMRLNVSASSEPEPDLAVVRGAPRTVRKHPTTAVLLVEISETTLLYDRRKASLYASRGVRDCWIGNLIDRVVEVRRKPVVDDEALGTYVRGNHDLSPRSRRFRRLGRARQKCGLPIYCQ